MELEGKYKCFHSLSISGFDFEFSCRVDKMIEPNALKWTDLASSSRQLIRLLSDSLIECAEIYLFTEHTEVNEKEWDFINFLIGKLDCTEKDDLTFCFLYLSENYICNPFLEKCIQPLRYSMFRFLEAKEKRPKWDLRINVEFADFGVYFSKKYQDRMIATLRQVKNLERLSELFLAIVASPEFDEKSIQNFSQLFNSRASNIRRWNSYLIVPNIIMQKSFMSISDVKEFNKSKLTELNFTLNCADFKALSALCKELDFLVGGALRKLNIMLIYKYQKSILDEFLGMLNKFTMQLTRFGMSIYTEFEHYSDYERKAILNLIQNFGPQLNDLSIFSLRDDIFSQVSWPLLRHSLSRHRLLHLSLLTEEEMENTKNDLNIISFAEVNRFLLSFNYSIMKLNFMTSKRDKLLELIRIFALKRKLLLLSSLALRNGLKSLFKRKAIIKDISNIFFV